MNDVVYFAPRELGPIYGIPLVESMRLGTGGMHQAMPCRDELERCRSRGFERVVAAYEVLLAHYRELAKEKATQ